MVAVVLKVFAVVVKMIVNIAVVTVADKEMLVVVVDVDNQKMFVALVTTVVETVAVVEIDNQED